MLKDMRREHQALNEQLLGRRAPLKDVRSEVIAITPEIAAAWLDKNVINRKPRPGVIEKFASDMRAGRWRLSFDPIRFDIDNVLLDGQHRLMACVKAGVPFTSLVVYNLPAEMRDVIDTGSARSLADVLQLKGVASSRLTAGTVRWLLAARNGETMTNKRTPSVQEVMDVLRRHPAIGASVNAAVPRTVSPSPTLLAFIHYAATHIIGVPETASAFVEVFRTGIPSREHCPAHKLREFVIQNRSSRAQIRHAEYWNAMLTVWNAFSRGDGMRSLRWGKDVTMNRLDITKL